jgi:hypothetical protein
MGCWSNEPGYDANDAGFWLGGGPDDTDGADRFSDDALSIRIGSVASGTVFRLARGRACR